MSQKLLVELKSTLKTARVETVHKIENENASSAFNLLIKIIS